MNNKDDPPQNRFKRHNDARIQIVQIKVKKDSIEHKALVRAIHKVKKATGIESNKDLFLHCLNESANKQKK